MKNFYKTCLTCTKNLTNNTDKSVKKLLIKQFLLEKFVEKIFLDENKFEK